MNNHDDYYFEDDETGEVTPPAPAAGAAIVRQDFSSQEIQQQNETAALAIAASARAQIEARYVLAMRRPRDWDLVRDRLLKECGRPGFAEAAIYRKPVGRVLNKKTNQWEDGFVEGLSVRFAEAALRYMTNFYADATAIYDDQRKKIVRVTVMDLETNATVATDVTVVKTVERKKLREGQRSLGTRPNSEGQLVHIVEASDDQILNKENALVSKALRNGVLRLLPGDVQDECEAKCREIAARKDAEDPAGAKKKLFDSFSAIGISPAELKRFLGHSKDTLEPKELADLRAIFAAVRQGETTWKAIMELREEADAGGANGNGNGGRSASARATEALLEKHRKAQAQKGNGKSDQAAPAAGEQNGAAPPPQPLQGEAAQAPGSQPRATAAAAPGATPESASAPDPSAAAPDPVDADIARHKEKLAAEKGAAVESKPEGSSPAAAPAQDAPPAEAQPETAAAPEAAPEAMAAAAPPPSAERQPGDDPEPYRPRRRRP